MIRGASIRRECNDNLTLLRGVFIWECWMASFRVKDCKLEIDCHRNNCPQCHDVHLRFPARVNSNKQCSWKSSHSSENEIATKSILSDKTFLTAV